VINSGAISIVVGYSDTTISWTFVDAFPSTYTIELVETGLTIGPIIWTSGTPINYRIPDGLTPGVYTFNITVTDGSGNSRSVAITVTVISETPEVIPFGNAFLLFTALSIFGLIFVKKRKIRINSK